MERQTVSVVQRNKGRLGSFSSATEERREMKTLKTETRSEAVCLSTLVPDSSKIVTM